MTSSSFQRIAMKHVQLLIAPYVYLCGFLSTANEPLMCAPCTRDLETWGFHPYFRQLTMWLTNLFLPSGFASVNNEISQTPGGNITIPGLIPATLCELSWIMAWLHLIIWEQRHNTHRWVDTTRVNTNTNPTHGLNESYTLYVTHLPLLAYSSVHWKGT